MKAGTSTTSAAKSTGAGGGLFCGQSKAGKDTFFSGKLEEDASALKVIAEALSSPGTKTQWLRERLASTTLQQK